MGFGGGSGGGFVIFCDGNKPVVSGKNKENKYNQNFIIKTSCIKMVGVLMRCTSYRPVVSVRNSNIC